MTNDEIISSVRSLVKGEQPITDVCEILFRHKCFYLLSMLKNNPYLKTLTLARVVNSAALKERYTALQPFFENSPFPYAVIKGAVLSQAAYKDLLIRSSGDIDILISRKNSDQMKEYLRSLGFIQGRILEDRIVPFSRREILFQTAMSHQTAPYVKETESKLCPFINVDVNTDIFWGERNEKADMDFVLSNTCVTNVLGLKINKLSPEAEFISLCLHHYKDMNSLYLLYEGSLTLSHYCDIYFYLINNALDRQKLTDLAEKLNAGQYLYYCIYYANLIFDSPVLNKYLTLLEKHKNQQTLDSYGLTKDEQKAWQITFFDRLFHQDLQSYIKKHLTQKDMNNILENKTNFR